jgi:hypothetical protein
MCRILVALEWNMVARETHDDSHSGALIEYSAPKLRSE